MLENGEGYPEKLADDSSYGKALDIKVGGRKIRWIPLAHPAAPKAYQTAHARWMENSGVV
jgi:hypothetical protein